MCEISLLKGKKKDIIEICQLDSLGSKSDHELKPQNAVNYYQLVIEFCN